jgi:hypothetical protein
MITEIKNDYIYAHVNGHFSLTQAQNLLTKSLEVLIENNFSKLLIDVSSMTGHLSIIERFLFGEYCAINAYKLRERGLKYLKIAIYGLEPIIDSERFGETVARNRGLDVRETTDVYDALQFLGNTFNSMPISQTYL